MRIFIVRNNYNSEAIDASMMLSAYLASQGIEYTIADSGDLAGALPNSEFAPLFNGEVEGGVDMAIALGGDGTILRCARQIQNNGTPILGINYGTLGFLANPNKEGVVAMCAAALAGDTVREERSNLEVVVVCEGEADPWGDDDEDASARRAASSVGEAGARAGAGAGAGAGARTGGVDGFSDGTAELSEPHYMFALNEAAITRGANGRIIEFGLNIAGSKLANMRGDGLVVSTSTGSTAYALSAGGPIVAPGFTGLIAVPIAPHALHSRAVVTSPNDVIEMVLENSQAERDATLFLDGELAEFPAPIRKMYVRRGGTPTTLLRYKAQNFYNQCAQVFF